MAQEIWLVIRDGKEYGPYSPQNLKDMAGKGQITPDDMVRRHDMAVPRQAKLLKGLFLAPPPTAPPSPPPPPPLLQNTPTRTAPPSLPPPSSPQDGIKEVQASRPGKVGQALILLYGSLGIGLLLSFISIVQIDKAYGISGEDKLDAALAFLLGSLIGLFLGWFFIYMIGKGRNWARITFLILFSLGVPLTVLPLLKLLQANPVIGLLQVAQTIMQLLALIFLFEKSSSEWFRRMRVSRRSA